ncbi:MAG: DciA family protein [Actinomycetota bacterium]|nr:DciA family protein [Actinomycetota bacterium]
MREDRADSEEETSDVTPSTTSRGEAEGPVDNDPVRAALDGAQRIARGNAAPRRRRSRRGGSTDAPRGGYSGPGPDHNDPQPIGVVLRGYTEDRGWQRPLAEARVFAEWAALVGPDVAAHCSPTALHAGELRVAAESTAWATQLRLLAATLLARLASELGPTTVTKVMVTGPVGPSWKHGRFAVPGARGPRDTYG